MAAAQVGIDISLELVTSTGISKSVWFASGGTKMTVAPSSMSWLKQKHFVSRVWHLLRIAQQKKATAAQTVLSSVEDDCAINVAQVQAT